LLSTMTSLELIKKLLPTKLPFTKWPDLSADKPVLTKISSSTSKSSPNSRKEPVPPKDTLLRMEKKTSKFHLSEISRLIFTPRLLLKKKLIISLISGKLKEHNVDKLLSPRNTRPTLRNSIKILRKVPVPAKDLPSKKDIKISKFH